ncbi:MAG: MBOAT family O-acyltransferase [Terracidiphilus sp.]
MLFVEPRFFLFIAIVLLVYWSLKTNNARKSFILCASFFFYGSWDWRFACMLAGLSAGDFFFALKMSGTDNPHLRRYYVISSLTMNLSVLGFFKYFHFFVGSAIALANTLHMNLSEPTIRIILPVGVSFFTFQSLSYTIDVYRREIPAVTSLRDYMMFASFFPQLVAGPIVRPKYFVPQMQEKRSVTLEEVKSALFLFLLGYIKKACIADNISPFVDKVFNHPASYSGLASINAVWLYAIQIFCDFSGYSDMAIAVAALLGFKLVLNFDAPYLAVTIQDFWRRWHISLSNWIRDYIYISLGGRSKKLWLTYRNLMLTMLTGGLWHGAAWTFVGWGGAHGAALVAHEECKRRLPVAPWQEPCRRIASWFLTLNFVCITWILFRASNFGVAWIMLRRYLLLDHGGPDTIPLWLAWLGPALLIVQYSMRRAQLQKRMCQLQLPTFAFAYGLIWSLAIALLPLGYRPFIYFQF